MHYGKSVVVAAALVLVALSGVSSVNAADSSFSITPPPIASPVFGVKETDLKVGAMYLNMKSTATTTQSFELTGYGVDATGRTAFGNTLAVDYNVGVTYLTGDMGTGAFKSTLSGASIPISFNLEVQPYKNDVFNTILFAGPAFSISAMTMESTVGGTTYTTYVDTYMYGLEAGVQMGLKLGDVHVDAFGMAITQSGTQDMTSSSASVADTSTSIPSFTTTSFGVDFMYIPWGLTLSSIMQEAGQSDDKGFKTTMYQISWSHKF